MSTEVNNGAHYGWAYSTKLGRMVDSYVEWGAIVHCEATPDGSSTEVYTRSGPMVRAYGSLTNASFYCVALGDVPQNYVGSDNIGCKYGRILKVTGADLSQDANSRASWPTGSVGYLTHPTSGSSGYFWFGDLDTRYRLRCETVTGSAKVTIQKSLSPYSSWTDLYGPFYDGSSPITSGYSGFFSAALDAEDHRLINFEGHTKIENLNANTGISAEVELLFVLAGPEANMTMEEG